MLKRLAIGAAVVGANVAFAGILIAGGALVIAVHVVMEGPRATWRELFGREEGRHG